MSLLWFGGEDLDFLGGVTVTTTAGRYRSGYARCSVSLAAGTQTKCCSSFGPITSGWATARVYVSTTVPSGTRVFGFCDTNYKGVCVSTNGQKVRIGLYDGSTYTHLAEEPGASLSGSTLIKLDLQVVNYGAASTIKLYANGDLVIVWTGDSSISGVAGFTNIFIGQGSGGTNVGWQFSEVIVADEDTRAMYLQTGALTGNGSVQWTGTFTDANEAAINDATAVYTNTAAQDEQFDITDLPSGYFDVLGVKVAVRASSPAGSTATKVGLGVKNGANVDIGTLQAPGTAWTTLERYMATDPTKSAAWDAADWSALQLALRSGS